MLIVDSSIIFFCRGSRVLLLFSPVAMYVIRSMSCFIFQLGAFYFNIWTGLLDFGTYRIHVTSGVASNVTTLSIGPEVKASVRLYK